MSERLYYHDSFCRSLETRIDERVLWDGQPALILAETIFYPEGGGQPADHGLINGVKVLHTLIRESDHAILHLMAGEVAGESALCELDWPRRFDHMQHHTGQHVLTHAFEKIAEAHTIGFHLGEEIVTIDLDRLIESVELIGRVEDYANQIVTADHPVIARLMDESDQAKMRIRKQPDFIATDRLRVIDIPGIDLTACGGTHVSATGQIGLIKVVRTSKYKAGTRVDFLCGNRALKDYRRKDAILSNLAKTLTTAVDEVAEAVNRQLAIGKEQTSTIKKLREQLLSALVGDLSASAQPINGVRFIQHVLEDHEGQAGRWLASSLIEANDMLALIGQPGEKAQIILARGSAVALPLEPLAAWVKEILPEARGGGRPDFIQLGGFSASAEQIRILFAAIADDLA